MTILTPTEDIKNSFYQYFMKKKKKAVIFIYFSLILSFIFTLQIQVFV